MKETKNIFIGVILVIIGIILGLNALGLANIDLLFDGWWTLFIIIPSFVGVIKEKDKSGDLIGLLVGVGLLLACQDVLSFELLWKLALPTIIICFGISFILKEFSYKGFNKKIKALKKNNKENSEYYSTFSSQKLNFDEQKIDGVKLNAIFGSTECDLQNANIGKENVINITSIFGSVNISIPNDVNVIIKSSSIFGSAEDQRKKNKNEKQTKTLYINAFCLFGGVEIK